MLMEKKFIFVELIKMANKRKLKPVTLRESIYEQEHRLKQQAKELLKQIKDAGKISGKS